MAKGSEQFTWAAVGGKRPCETCDASIPIDRVRVYSSGVTRGRHDAYVVCEDCWPAGWLTLMHKEKTP